MLIWHFCYKTLAVTNIVCFWLHNQARVNLASLNPLYQMWGLTSPMWVIPQDNKESSNEQNIFRYKSARHIKHLLFFYSIFIKLNPNTILISLAECNNSPPNQIHTYALLDFFSKFPSYRSNPITQTMFKALNWSLIDHLIHINNKRFFIFIFIFHLMGSTAWIKWCHSLLS
jgi:hypothetical protein